MENLNVFDGGANLVAELPPPGAAHSLWTSGVNSAGRSLRSLRILMPLSLAVNILENADPSKFVEMADAVCPLEVLKVLPEWLYFLKSPLTVSGLRKVITKEAHFKVLELALNYEAHIVRDAFRTLPKGHTDKQGRA